MMRLEDRHLHLRRLSGDDLPAVARILQRSEYTYFHSGLEELPGLVDSMPSMGAFVPSSQQQRQHLDTTVQAFLLVNWLVPPSAWLGGFGVVQSEGDIALEYFDLLLPRLEELAADRGARTLYYSGSDLDTDWLRSHLEARDFLLHSTLRSYDKEDFSIPDEGNIHLLVRQFEPADAPATVAVEDLAFEQLWRHDAASFLEVRRYYPYFVVAVDADGIVGYQYNTVEAGIGYLVRIAVHPRVQGQGIGTRLMAEAVRYFQEHRVEKIVLNADEKNHRAQSLYLRFGFHKVYSRGFVLERALLPAAGSR